MGWELVLEKGGRGEGEKEGKREGEEGCRGGRTEQTYRQWQICFSLECFNTLMMPFPFN